MISLPKIKNALKYGYLITDSRIPQLLSWVISIRAITIYPFIIYRDEPDDRSMNHERIHIIQQREMWVFAFYPLYYWYWLVNRFWYKDSGSEAYYNIPFEREAYHNDENFSYIKTRPRHAWKKYFHPRDD